MKSQVSFIKDHAMYTVRSGVGECMYTTLLDDIRPIMIPNGPFMYYVTDPLLMINDIWLISD